MKIGLKLWSSNQLLFAEAVRLFKLNIIDFIEVLFNPSKPFAGIKTLTGIPITVHAPTENLGINLMLITVNNGRILKQTIQFADFVGTDTLIIHPGVGNSIKTLNHNLQQIEKLKIIIENMPKIPLPNLEGGMCFGYSFNQLKQLINYDYGFCLDVNHAIKAAISQTKDYRKYILKLMSLDPRYFHISDGTLTKEYDEHLNLGFGEYDLVWIKKNILQGKDIKMVFETPKEDNSLENDVRNIEYFKSL